MNTARTSSSIRRGDPKSTVRKAAIFQPQHGRTTHPELAERPARPSLGSADREGVFQAAYYRPRLYLRLWRRCGRCFFWLACWVTHRCPGGVTPVGSGHIVGLFPFCPQERRRHGGAATDFSAPWRLSRLPIIRRRARVRRPLFRSHVPAACRGELPVPARPGHYGTRRSDAGPD